MVLCRIKLEPGEKLIFRTSRTGKKIDSKCPNCKERFSVELHKWEREKWFLGECWQCGYRFSLMPKECDLIQPDSPLFKIYYEFNPVEEEKARKKNKEKNRGNELDNMLLNWKTKHKSYEYDYMKKYVEEREAK